MIRKKIFRIIIFCIFCFLFISGGVFATTLNMDVGETYNYNGVSITCDNNANCTSTIGEESFLGLSQNTNIGADSLVLFWNSDKTVGLVHGNSRGAGSVWQRYINSGCPVAYSVGTTYDNYVTDYMQGCTNNTGNYQSRLENASTYAGKLTSLRFNTFGNQGLICWNYNEELGSFCINFQLNMLSEPTDYGMTYPVTIDKVNTIATISPFVGGGGGNDGDIITNTGSITNFEAILGYNYIYGFNESYCYGGYPLSDIFESTDNPQYFTGFELGSGAYIYDIYNAYSGSYFTSASQFYQSFYSRYLINNIASFYNYPKALYGIVERYAWLYDHYQTYDPNIGISKLVSYCELYKLDPDALYTGGDITAENGYSNLIGEITDKWRYYDSGPLSILSGDNVKFGSDEFFTNILNKINTSLDNVSNNAGGVIPSYILVVLVALILFRIMSH